MAWRPATTAAQVFGGPHASRTPLWLLKEVAGSASLATHRGDAYCTGGTATVVGPRAILINCLAQSRHRLNIWVGNLQGSQLYLQQGAGVWITLWALHNGLQSGGPSELKCNAMQSHAMPCDACSSTRVHAATLQQQLCVVFQGRAVWTAKSL